MTAGLPLPSWLSFLNLFKGKGESKPPAPEALKPATPSAKQNVVGRTTFNPNAPLRSVFSQLIVVAEERFKKETNLYGLPNSSCVKTIYLLAQEALKNMGDGALPPKENAERSYLRAFTSEKAFPSPTTNNHVRDMVKSLAEAGLIEPLSGSGDKVVKVPGPNGTTLEVNVATKGDIQRMMDSGRKGLVQTTDLTQHPEGNANTGPFGRDIAVIGRYGLVNFTFTKNTNIYGNNPTEQVIWVAKDVVARREVDNSKRVSSAPPFLKNQNKPAYPADLSSQIASTKK